MSLPEEDSSEEKKVQILAELAAKSPDLRRKLLQHLGVPLSKNSDTYYSAEAARTIQPIIDQMIEDKMDREFLYADYYGWSPNTIRQKLFSGIRYLLDYFDDKGKYKAWRSKVEITKIPDGIRLRWVSNPSEMKLRFTARIVAREDNPLTAAAAKANAVKASEWKNIIISFIDGSDKSVTISDINLSPEDKEWIRNLFEPLEEFTVRGDTNSVRIVRARIDDPKIRLI